MTEQDFLKSVQEHAMTIENDNGVHRCVHFGKPGIGTYHFRLVTWPGHLAISGDMGDFTFSRLEDMFDFFRGESINPRYWGEKLTAVSQFGGYKVFDWDLFAANLKDRLIDQHDDQHTADEIEAALMERLRFADEDEYGAVELIRNWDEDEDFLRIDPCDAPTGEKYSFQYLWCLYAIVWGIHQYDKAKEQDR